MHGCLEVVGAGGGPATFIHHVVSRLLGLDEVVSDGHGDFIVTLLVGLRHSAAGGHQLAVNIEIDTLDRDIRVFIIDVPAHGEAGAVGEIYIVRRE